MKCPKCGKMMRFVLVTTPVWDGIFRCSGGGEVLPNRRYECLNCGNIERAYVVKEAEDAE